MCSLEAVRPKDSQAASLGSDVQDGLCPGGLGQLPVTCCSSYLLCATGNWIVPSWLCFACCSLEEGVGASAGAAFGIHL